MNSAHFANLFLTSWLSREWRGRGEEKSKIEVKRVCKNLGAVYLNYSCAP